LRKILERNGFARKHGMKVLLEKIVNGETQTVFVPDYKRINRKTAEDIINSSGLRAELFDSLLKKSK